MTCFVNTVATPYMSILTSKRFQTRHDTQKFLFHNGSYVRVTIHFRVRIHVTIGFEFDSRGIIIWYRQECHSFSGQSIGIGLNNQTIGIHVKITTRLEWSKDFILLHPVAEKLLYAVDVRFLRHQLMPNTKTAGGDGIGYAMPRNIFLDTHCRLGHRSVIQ